MCWLTTHGFFQKEGEKQWNEMYVCFTTGLGYWSFLLNVPVYEYVTTEHETVFINKSGFSPSQWKITIFCLT